MEDKIKIAVCNRKTDKRYKNQEWTWEDIVGRNRNPVRTSETMKEYPGLSKSRRDELKDQGGFVGGWLKNGVRRNGNVTVRTLGTLDADSIPSGTDFLDLVGKALDGIRHFIYSTHSHTPELQRFRIAVPFSRNVSEEEYPAVMRQIAKGIGMDYFDDTTYQANRMMYWSSCPSDAPFVFLETDGKPLEPDKYLAMYDDWRDLSQWPVSSRESEVAMRDTASHQADPLAKEGIVGAFCRTYTIDEAIGTFLGDVYDPSATDGRYDYIRGEGTAGVATYDDRFAYSHHATDPACGRLLNAFDLVRIHRFGDEDPKKSFKAMCDLASADDRVKLQIALERRRQAGVDFKASDDDMEWQKNFEYEPRSTVLRNSLHNLMLILQNDPKLKGIRYNEFSDGMEVGNAPWRRPDGFKYWREADDAQLVAYVDSTYGTFSARNYDLAVTKVCDDRSYHPIRDFFSSLPEWDGKPRVDTLLMDCFGATDNPYVRAVTRKTFVGAVARIMRPGCKFDTMLVLNGFQGQKKSSLLRRLCGEWFSDDISFAQTKDKTAAEKLQGYWIIEFSEMTGLKKADIEGLKSFISRQNDIYRAAYGKRPTPHLRQCIFIGTTNADNGFLRDPTGNRRYWPVKTVRKYEGDPADIDEDYVRQFWAEALHRYAQGERLYLEDDSILKYAVLEQREAMETDEREGIVGDYLAKPLPSNWEDMDLFARRNFLDGEELTGQKRIGLKARRRVCTMEIWCECFGRERSQLSKRDSGEIAAIMARIPGWEKMTGKQRFGVYGIVGGYERTEEQS